MPTGPFAMHRIKRPAIVLLLIGVILFDARLQCHAAAAWAASHEYKLSSILVSVVNTNGNVRL
ncbi:hypothetical protein IAQ61_000666, partial [Plenodomus lingam]|uniref:uncharacterized protein n=1 Tax=Leptosphaeria maculans TaxID=5022 RepID=UPI003328C4D8